MQGQNAPSHNAHSPSTFWENAPLIHNDAIFIADAHFMPSTPSLSEQSKEASQALLDYFKYLLSAPQTIPSQIFLMGDIAHLLLGGVDSSYKANQNLLSLIESLSKQSQIWWFEGNHDFTLSAFKKPFLEHIHIITRTQQPKAFCFKYGHIKKRILLAHGDIFLHTKYELYIRLMHTRFIRALMYLLDNVTFGNLYTYIIAKVNQKNIRVGKIEMSAFAPLRVNAYTKYMQKSLKGADSSVLAFDAIIEGHFHIGQTYNNGILYVSLPSFYVNRSIFAIKSLFDLN